MYEEIDKIDNRMGSLNSVFGCNYTSYLLYFFSLKSCISNRFVHVSGTRNPLYNTYHVPSKGKMFPHRTACPGRSRRAAGLEGALCRARRRLIETGCSSAWSRRVAALETHRRTHIEPSRSSVILACSTTLAPRRIGSRKTRAVERLVAACIAWRCIVRVEVGWRCTDLLDFLHQMGSI